MTTERLRPELEGEGEVDEIRAQTLTLSPERVGSDGRSTSEWTIAALGYLRHAFGGFSIPEQEERAHLRVFRGYSAPEVQMAIDDLCRSASRRPSPNEIAQRLRLGRKNGLTDELERLENRRLSWVSEHPGEPVPTLDAFVSAPDSREIAAESEPDLGKLASERVAKIKAQMPEHLRGRYRPHAERREGVAVDAVKV